MEMKIFSLKENKDRDIYCYLDVKQCESPDFQFKFSLDVLKQNEEIQLNNEGTNTQFYVLSGELKDVLAVDGQQMEGAKQEKIALYQAGRSYFARAGRKYKALSDGRVFSATMARNVRGSMRHINIEGSMKMRIGEAVGTCVIAFFGANAEFSLELEDKSITCTPDSVILLLVEKAEYLDICLKSEKKDVHLEYAGFAVLGRNDFGKSIGVELLKDQDDKCYGKLVIRPEHLNPIGVVHGGCIFTLADAVCGFTVGSMGGISTTVNSHIQYLNPSFSPKYLIAEVKPRKMGKLIRNLDVEIRDDQNVVIAFAEFVFCNLQK